jgi:hypothetical protein
VAVAFSAAAQVSVELTLDQDQFLPGESVPVAVRITNRSGRTLELGDSNDWLTFAVESRQVSSGIVSMLEDVPVKGAFTLPSSKRAIKRVDISPYFAITGPGKYTVSATVRIPGWQHDITSAPIHFYVIEGTKIWQQEVGLPADGTNSLPQIRRYLLQHASQQGGQANLYLRVTDETGLQLFRLEPIGRVLSFSRPEPQVDSKSNLHLLYQNGPATFAYLEFTPNGDIVQRQMWEYSGDSRPRLRSDEAGKIFVTGGVRRLTREDIPPSNDLATGNLSVPTNAPITAPEPEATPAKKTKKPKNSR